METLLTQLIAYVGEDYTSDQDTLLETLLEDALEEVINHMYPYGPPDEYDETTTDDEGNETTVTVNPARVAALKRYRGVIRRIAEYHYDKIGKEGVTHFNENGSYGTYEASGTPPSYFVGIMPVAQIV